MNAKFNQYLYTDMASELFQSAQRRQAYRLGHSGNPLHDSGMDYNEQYYHHICREKLVIASKEASDILGKTVGTYYTIHTGDLRFLSEEDRLSCKAALHDSVLDAASQLCPDFQLPIDTWKNNTVGSTTADFGFDKGSVLRTSIDDPGKDAWDRIAVSPEWAQEAHLYNAPIACVLQESHADEVRAEGEPFLSVSADTNRSAVTDIPPAPLSEQTPPRPMTILVVGLGNPALTTDALGPMCVSHLHVTRHIVGMSSPDISFPQDDIVHRLCAITPLVLGKTGIETLDLVRGAVRAVQPDLVILVDALAASEIGSLTKTIQISTTGIYPGGGVGNKRQPLDKETLGVPVMTIGVPTVVAASTLIYRALEGAGILEQDDTMNTEQNTLLQNALASADIGYVAPKDIDESITVFSHLLAQTINELVLGPKLAASLGSGF